MTIPNFPRPAAPPPGVLVGKSTDLGYQRIMNAGQGTWSAYISRGPDVPGGVVRVFTVEAPGAFVQWVAHSRVSGRDPEVIAHEALTDNGDDPRGSRIWADAIQPPGPRTQEWHDAAWPHLQAAVYSAITGQEIDGALAAICVRVGLTPDEITGPVDREALAVLLALQAGPGK